MSAKAAKAHTAAVRSCSESCLLHSIIYSPPEPHATVPFLVSALNVTFVPLAKARLQVLVALS